MAQAQSAKAAAKSKTKPKFAPGEVWSAAAKTGTQREYESVLILRPETAKPEILAFLQRIQKVFSERGARLIKIDSWGMRILAYPIRRCTKGIYMYWRYLGGSDVVAEFERNLGNLDFVLRYQSVRIDEDVDPEARPSEVTEELIEAASDPGPDPEEEARKAAEAAARAAEEARKAAEEAAAAAAAAAEAEKTAAEDSGEDQDQ